MTDIHEIVQEYNERFDFVSVDDAEGLLSEIASLRQQLSDERQTVALLQESHLKICDELTEAKRQLAVELQRFNTSWQHDPPQPGDTRCVRVRFNGPADPVTYEWLDEEPLE